MSFLWITMFILETERLWLRKLLPSDALFAFELNSDPEVLRFTGDDAFDSVEEARSFLAAYPDYDKNGYGRWGVVLKSTGNLIGWCGLKKHPEYVDIGFRFFRDQWGKGYATEAAKACIQYGFEVFDMDLIVGRVARENVASVRVLEKLNLTFWKEDECDGIEDSLYYRITKDSYQPK